MFARLLVKVKTADRTKYSMVIRPPENHRKRAQFYLLKYPPGVLCWSTRQIVKSFQCSAKQEDLFVERDVRNEDNEAGM